MKTSYWMGIAVAVLVLGGVIGWGASNAICSAGRYQLYGFQQVGTHILFVIDTKTGKTKVLSAAVSGVSGRQVNIPFTDMTAIPIMKNP